MQDMDGGFALTGMTGTAYSGNLSVQDKDVVEITTTSGTLAVTLINMVDGQIVWIVNKGASYSCTCAGVTIKAGKSALAKYSSSGSVWRVFTN
jgi:Fe-S cluster biogenesis protein NfuA